MHDEQPDPCSADSIPDEVEPCPPPAIDWNLPAPRLQGVPFEGPITKITTVSTPIRPKKET